jgi:hypothetical protein
MCHTCLPESEKEPVSDFEVSSLALRSQQFQTTKAPATSLVHTISALWWANMVSGCWAEVLRIETSHTPTCFSKPSYSYIFWIGKSDWIRKNDESSLVLSERKEKTCIGVQTYGPEDKRHTQADRRANRKWTKANADVRDRQIQRYTDTE